MKGFRSLFMLLLCSSLLFSCAEVDNGFKGVAYKPYDNGLDPEKIYEEGVHTGFSWMMNDMITYDCRQKTTTISTTLLDRDGMDVPVTASVFHRIMPTKIGYLHLEKGQDYAETYLTPIVEGVLKDVIGQYKAQDLIVSKRQEAQAQMKKYLTEAFAKNYLMCDDIILRDIGLPPAISNAITEKQVQEERNLLSEKKKVEEENLAAARIAKAQGNYQAAEFDAKTKAIMSDPKMLDLLKLENERAAIDKWEGTFGTNNVFQDIPMIRGLMNSK